MNDLAEAVRHRAAQRCEYCHVPQSAFRRSFHIEHITARQHGGLTQPDNLALACWNCNLRKGPNLSGIDPDTQCVVTLFHPGRESWADHFSACVTGSNSLRVEIRGLTATGRATVQVLSLNDEIRQMLRYELWLEGLFEASVCRWLPAAPYTHSR